MNKNIFKLGMILLLTVSVASNVYSKESFFTDVTHMAIVIRGGEKVIAGTPDQLLQAMDSSGSDTALVGVLFGLGGLVGNSMAKGINQKSAAKFAVLNQSRQLELDNLLAGWQPFYSFKEKLMQNLKTINPSFSELSFLPDSSDFLPVTRDYYKKGNKSYAKEEKVFDYSSLAQLGFSQVLEINFFSYLWANKTKAIPKGVVIARIIHLANKDVLDKQMIFSKPVKMLKFERYTENSASLTKESFDHLASEITLQLIKKYN